MKYKLILQDNLIKMYMRGFEFPEGRILTRVSSTSHKRAWWSPWCPIFIKAIALQLNIRVINSLNQQNPYKHCDFEWIIIVAMLAMVAYFFNDNSQTSPTFLPNVLGIHQKFSKYFIYFLFIVET